MDKKEAARQLGSLGGKATFKKVGKKGMQALGNKSAYQRWGKKHESRRESKSI